MDGGGFFRTQTAAPMRPCAAVVTGCAAACRLAKSARMASERLTRWAAEMGGGDGRRRWAAEVGGGGRRQRWAAEVGGGDGRRRWAAEVGGGGRRRR